MIFSTSSSLYIKYCSPVYYMRDLPDRVNFVEQSNARSSLPFFLPQSYMSALGVRMDSKKQPYGRNASSSGAKTQPPAEAPAWILASRMALPSHSQMDSVSASASAGTETVSQQSAHSIQRGQVEPRADVISNQTSLLG